MRAHISPSPGELDEEPLGSRHRVVPPVSRHRSRGFPGSRLPRRRLQRTIEEPASRTTQLSGRLPAESAEGLRKTDRQLLAYENGKLTLDSPFVPVAGAAGEIREGRRRHRGNVRPGREPKRIFLRALGPSATWDAINNASTGGRSLSCIGHGGIHRGADENGFASSGVRPLSPPACQLSLHTMNWLNGYFRFTFDSLPGPLLKDRPRNARAARRNPPRRSDRLRRRRRDGMPQTQILTALAIASAIACSAGASEARTHATSPSCQKITVTSPARYR